MDKIFEKSHTALTNSALQHTDEGAQLFRIATPPVYQLKRLRVRSLNGGDFLVEVYNTDIELSQQDESEIHLVMHAQSSAGIVDFLSPEGLIYYNAAGGISNKPSETYVVIDGPVDDYELVINGTYSTN